MTKNTIFARTLKSYRLKSGYTSASSFLYDLAEFGFICETSTYHRWERGVRIPSKREDIVVLLKAIRKRLPLTLDEANKFCNMSNHGFLTDEERKRIYGDGPQISNMASYDISNIISSWDTIRDCLWYSSKWHELESLLLYLLTAMQESPINDQILATLYVRDLAWLYYWKGNIEMSELYLHRAYQLTALHDNLYLKALYFQRLGKLLQVRKEFSKSECYLKKALSLFSYLENNNKQGETLTYLAQTKLLNGDSKKANALYKNALLVSIQADDIRQQSIIYSDMGLYELTNKNYAKSKGLLENSVELAKKTGGICGSALWNNIGFGVYYKRKGEYQKFQQVKALASQERKQLQVNIMVDTHIINSLMRKHNENIIAYC